MSDMIERVAMVLCAQSQDDWAIGEKHWRGQAVEVIAALREPTPAVEDAGLKSILRGGTGWQAMIDEALREGGAQ